MFRRSQKSYAGPLTQINGKSIQGRHSSVNSKGRGLPAVAGEDMTDIDAEPLSSSEEENPQVRNISVACESPQPAETKSSLDKPSPNAGKRRRVRPRIKDTQVELSDESLRLEQGPASPNPNLGFFDEMDAFSSQPSQKRRKKIHTYGSRNSAPSASAPDPISLNVPPRPSAYETASPLTGFNDVGPIKKFDSPPPDFPKHQLDIRPLPVPLELERVAPKLDVPAELACEPTSSSTTGMTGSQTFSLSDEYAAAKSRVRSSSISSLSSIDSGASLVMTRGEKLALMEDDSPDSWRKVRCPLCNAQVHRAHLDDFSGGRHMGIRAQQRFCQEHKEREAKSTVDRHGYPSIDWDDLKKRRLQEHIGFLTKILRRKEPSYYLSKLDDTALTSSHRQLQHYLKQSTVDVVRNGYYGPKGAAVLSSGISTAMSKPLREALRKDKVVKATDVGGFVSAVLLPELLVKLVMEDMKINDEVAARRILEESTELGILVNGDD